MPTGNELMISCISHIFTIIFLSNTWPYHVTIKRNEHTIKRERERVKKKESKRSWDIFLALARFGCASSCVFFLSDHLLLLECSLCFFLFRNPLSFCNFSLYVWMLNVCFVLCVPIFHLCEGLGLSGASTQVYASLCTHSHSINEHVCSCDLSSLFSFYFSYMLL